MAYWRTFYVEAKMFVLTAEERGSVLKSIERSMGVSRAVHLGKASVGWLLEAVEALFREGG